MALRLEEWRLKMTDGVTAVLDKLNGSASGTAARFTKMQDRIAGAGKDMEGFGTKSNKALTGVGSGIKGELLANLQGQLPSSIGNVVGLFGGMAAPLIVAGGLVAGIALGLNKAVDAAAAFGVPFRELRNLNLDKPKAEIGALNDRILKLSFDKGLDPEKVTRAMYDIQSATGQYGSEVEEMAAKVGVASRALNIDYNQAVGAASKAMVAFKLPLSDVDALMASNAKTVQVGIVTFDELSRVQTAYAGAASSVNQEVDTANKVFALLSKTTKSADIAAEMAKASFQDLGRATTIAGLKQIGVNVFDVNGNMRQADAILRELVPKFRTMSDQRFAELKESIGGSEGLRGLLDLTKASGDDVLRTLDAFDSTGFDLGRTIKDASGDLDVINDTMNNKVKTSWVQLGQAVMPVWIDIKGVINDAILGVIDFTAKVDNLYNSSMELRSAIEAIAFIFKLAWNTVVAAIKVGIDLIMTPLKAIAQFFTGDWSGSLATIKTWGQDAEAAVTDAAANIGAAYNKGLQASLGSAPPMDPEAYKQLFGAGQANPFAAADAARAKGIIGNDPLKGLLGGSGKGGATGGSGLGGVAGGGQVRNVTINITKLVEKIEVHTSTSVKQGLNSIKAQVEEALVEIVRGTEATLATN